jgi:DeoR/GlpR family transcriptional regulator of sugar metabolism
MTENDRDARNRSSGMPADRHSRILQRLEDDGTARVEELAADLGVSVATIRRDLQHLENQGLLSRVFGGAMGVPDTAFAPRAQARVSDKGRIAKQAGALVSAGETIALETGTTVLAVATALQAPGVAIVTNSVDVLLATQRRTDMRVVVTGGTFDPNTRCMYGGLPEAFYANHHVDKLFIGAGSLDVDGLRDSNIDALAAKRAAISAAHEVIVVADSSKFQFNALTLVSAWDRIATLVTDADAPRDILDQIGAQDVRIIIAGDD